MLFYIKCSVGVLSPDWTLTDTFRKANWGTSLVVQWLRICLATQWTPLQSLLGELRSHIPRSN